MHPSLGEQLRSAFPLRDPDECIARTLARLDGVPSFRLSDPELPNSDNACSQAAGLEPALHQLTVSVSESNRPSPKGLPHPAPPINSDGAE